MQRWVVGLSDGREVWVQAEAAAVEHGCLVMMLRAPEGRASLVRAWAPGEWTKLASETGAVDTRLASRIEDFCRVMDADAPAGQTLRLVDRRQGERRRAFETPGRSLVWDGLERRGGPERRATC